MMSPILLKQNQTAGRKWPQASNQGLDWETTEALSPGAAFQQDPFDCRVENNWKGTRRKFPGGPTVRALCFHCRGHRFNPWSCMSRSEAKKQANKQKPTKKNSVQQATVLSISTRQNHHHLSQAVHSFLPCPPPSSPLPSLPNLTGPNGGFAKGCSNLSTAHSRWISLKLEL